MNKYFQVAIKGAVIAAVGLAFAAAAVSVDSPPGDNTLVGLAVVSGLVFAVGTVATIIATILGIIVFIRRRRWRR